MLQRGYLIKRMLSSARDLHVHQSGIAKKKTYLISAVGKDEIGLVHGISKLLSDHGGSISESRWATFGGDFVAFMNVHFPKVTEKEKECEVDKNNMRKGAKMKDIKEMLKEKFPAMHISIHSGTEMMVSEEHKKYYRVSACGPDVGGLIRDFSDSFQSAGISVLDMSTSVGGAPFAGYASFNMKGIISVPAGYSFDDLKNELDIMGKKNGLAVDAYPYIPYYEENPSMDEIPRQIEDEL